VRILPQVLVLVNQNFKKYFWSQQCQFTLFYLSHQCQRCHNIQYFGQHIEIFYKKGIVYQLYHLLGIYIDPDPGNGTTNTGQSSIENYPSLSAVALGNLESLKQEEKRVGAIVARFGQDWRQSLDQINREILSSFPNLRLGTGILQQTLTTLVQYYHRSRAKGYLTRDFRLQAFFMNPFPLGHYDFLRIFAEIFVSKG
jgi:hypothetical protein